MKISEVYAYAEKIGVLVFSTIHNNEVHSRVAYFNEFDEDGIYFRTMVNKPFCRQLEATNKVTVCGITDTTIIEHTKDGAPIFPPSYSFRLIGEVKKVNPQVIIEKSKTNKGLLTAAQDIEKYPAMAEGNFIIHKAKVEVFDVDLSGYFDTIPHNKLMILLKERISDPRVLNLIVMWLKCPIIEVDERGKQRVFGGKKNKIGTPQGGVISPLLANIYLNLLARASEYSGEALVIFGEDDHIEDPKVSKSTAEALSWAVLDVTGDTHSYSFYHHKPDIRLAIIAGTIDTFRTAFN